MPSTLIKYKSSNVNGHFSHCETIILISNPIIREEYVIHSPVPNTLHLDWKLFSSSKVYGFAEYNLIPDPA